MVVRWMQFCMCVFERSNPFFFNAMYIVVVVVVVAEVKWIESNIIAG